MKDIPDAESADGRRLFEQAVGIEAALSFDELESLVAILRGAAVGSIEGGPELQDKDVLNTADVLGRYVWEFRLNTVHYAAEHSRLKVIPTPDE